MEDGLHEGGQEEEAGGGAATKQVNNIVEWISKSNFLLDITKRIGFFCVVFDIDIFLLFFLLELMFPPLK